MSRAINKLESELINMTNAVKMREFTLDMLSSSVSEWKFIHDKTSC